MRKDLPGPEKGFTKKSEILPPEQQKEIAEYLGLDISELSPEEAQEKIDEEVAKLFGIRALFVINLGKERQQKFIVVRHNVQQNEYWFILTGPVRYHQELGRLLPKEGEIEIRGGGIIKVEDNKAIVYGMSFTYGEYSKEEIEIFKELLKENLEKVLGIKLESIEIGESAPY